MSVDNAGGPGPSAPEPIPPPTPGDTLKLPAFRPPAPAPTPAVPAPGPVPASGAAPPAPAGGGPTPTPAGRREIGEYVLQREIGRGGMGAVYLAVHRQTGERVALKELLVTQAADPVSVRRFLQEGELMSRLSHPNVVGVRDIIESPAGHYIALEFVEGESLRELLGGPPLPTPQAFALMHGLLQALDYAHQHGIVHRDVKPENVLISTRGEVKVADFGIARLTDDSATSHATKTGTTVGTPQYMSPEQVTTSKVDGRSDLYSAGIVCYELFCGRPPFEANESDGPFTLFAKHVQAPPPPPSVRRPGLDAALESTILKSLSKRPEDRYQTGAEFDRELSMIANRLCGPAWPHALEPGADLAAMRPAAPMPVATAAGPAAVTLRDLAAAAGPISPAPAPGAKGAGPGGRARPPADSRPARRFSPALMAGVAAAVLVLLAAGTVAVALAGRNHAQPAPATGANTAGGGSPVAQPDCTWLQAGAAVGAGLTGSCGVTLGQPVQLDSLAGQSALPADLKPQHGAAAAPQPATVPVTGGFAALTSSRPGDATWLAGLKPAGTDLAVIADFTPTTGAAASIGIGVRGGISVDVDPTGRATISESAPGAPPAVKFSQPVSVTLNAPSRLVVVVRGGRMSAWINGQLISNLPTSVFAPGATDFHVVTADPAKPASANLSALYVFSV